jgi:DNA modification methylase
MAHEEADLDRIATAMGRWGWTIPLLADEDGQLIVGHARLAAGARLGLTSVPVLVARGWSEEDKRAYRIFDNQMARRATWDPDLLRDELSELQRSGFDLGLTGFDPERLETILAGLRPGVPTDPDAVPDCPEQPVTKLGDVWLLGDHRVGCGDATSAGAVAAVLGEGKPHLMVTDPPYGVEYNPSWRTRRSGNRDAPIKPTVLNDDRADWRDAFSLFNGDVCYVWHGALHSGIVSAGLASCGLQPRAQIVWVKQHFTLSRGDYQWKHEALWYAVRDGKTSHWNGARTEATVWEFPNNNPFGNRHREQAWGHITQKPVECMRRPIQNNSRPGELIYDPFLGSGTSLIAAELSGRICYGLELCPAFVDVTVRRWQLFTGRAALDQASGQTFDERAEAISGTPRESRT